MEAYAEDRRWIDVKPEEVVNINIDGRILKAADRAIHRRMDQFSSAPLSDAFFATLGVACGQVSEEYGGLIYVNGFDKIRHIVPSDIRGFAAGFASVSRNSYRIIMDKEYVDATTTAHISVSKLNQVWQQLGGYEVAHLLDENRVGLVALGAPALELEELESFEAMASNYHKDHEVNLFISASPAALSRASSKTIDSLLAFGVDFLPNASTHTMLNAIQARTSHVPKNALHNPRNLAYSGLVTNSPTLAQAASRCLPKHRRTTNFSGLVGCLDAAVTARPPSRRPTWLLNQRRGFSAHHQCKSALEHPVHRASHRHLTMKFTLRRVAGLASRFIA